MAHLTSLRQAGAPSSGRKHSISFWDENFEHTLSLGEDRAECWGSEALERGNGSEALERGNGEDAGVLHQQPRKRTLEGAWP